MSAELPGADWPAKLVRILHTTPRALAVLLFLAWSTLMFVVSGQPVHDLGALMRPLGAWGHNTLHAPEYAVFAVLFLWATAGKGALLVENRRRIWLCVLVVLLYAASDEWHQSFTPGRDASASDVLTDVVGGLSAATLLYAAEKGASRAQMVRLFSAAVLACVLAALIATLLPATRPDLGWL